MSFRAEIEALTRAYLAGYSARDATACAAIYAEDATIWSPFGPPLHGRAAIAAAHEDWFGAAEEDKRLDILDCASAGDLGYCLMRYSAEVPGADGTRRREAGTNLAVMVRRDGAWRIHRSSMNEATPG